MTAKPRVARGMEVAPLVRLVGAIPHAPELSGLDRDVPGLPVDERPKASETGLASLHRFFGFEPFVDADVAAEFISSKRKTILDWARDGSIPAHPFGRGKRTEWRFRLSEIAGHTKPIQGTISTGSPEMVRPEKRYG
jgi:hypothetical protein